MARKSKGKKVNKTDESRPYRQANEEVAAALAWHRANLEQLIALIPSSCYVGLTVLEQFKRMAQDARSWREQRDRMAQAVKCQPCGCREGECENNPVFACRMVGELGTAAQ